MALTKLSWDIINKNLFVEGAKYWRTGYYNRKTGEESYICSEAKKTKCPCTALVRYFKRPNNDGESEQEQMSDEERGDSGQEQMSDEERGDSGEDMFDEDPRLNPVKYDITLVWASDPELHQRFHETDLMEAKSEELKEAMTELMVKDPTLEPSVVIDKVLNDFTDSMDGSAKGELLAIFYRTRRESHLRRLRRVKEDEWGRMPTTQKEFKPEVMDVMADGSRLLWADSMNEKEERTLVFTTAYLLTILSLCSKASVDGTFFIMSKLWRQCFIMMSHFGGSWIPIAFGFLPTKETASYVSFFELLNKLLSDTLGPSFSQNLRKILCDFEKGIHQAINKVYKGTVKIQGCFFHFSSCIWKKVQSNGVVNNYKHNKNLRNLVRSYVGFAHVPPNKLEEAYAAVNKTYIFTDPKEVKFKSYLENYFLKYWLHNKDIPVKMWNCWKRKKNLTNNGHEGYNGRLKRKIKSPHPNPNKLLSYLKKELGLAELYARHYENGGDPPYVAKKYRDLERTKSILKERLRNNQLSIVSYVKNIGGICLKIDKLSDERARAGVEANLDGGEPDGTFILQQPGKRAVLRKSISFSTRRVSARPRSFPSTGGVDDDLEGDLYEVDSDNDSLDELVELENRVDSEDDEGPSMIEVLPPAPGPLGPGTSSRPVPRFIPVRDNQKSRQRPVCPLCPRKFIVTSPYSICSVCHEQFHNSCIKKLKWGFPVPFRCQSCLTTPIESEPEPEPVYTSTVRRPGTQPFVPTSPPQDAASSPPSPSGASSALPTATLPSAPSRATPSCPTTTTTSLANVASSTATLACPTTTTASLANVASPTATHSRSTPAFLLLSEHHTLSPPVHQTLTRHSETSPLCVRPPPESTKLSLDIGEHFLNLRLLEEKFIRCPGQKFTPKDMNCGPHAILHQLCFNPVYEMQEFYSPEGHAMFRKMVAEHFVLQVKSGQNFWYEEGPIAAWVANMSRPGIMVDHYWLSAAAKMIGRCIILVPTFTQSSTHIGRIIRVWGGKHTAESPETAGTDPPLFLGYMEDNLYTGGHFQCIEPDPKHPNSPILRYLVGWDYESQQDVLPPPVPLPTPHIPLQNMPSHVSSLVIYNTSTDTQATVTADHYLTEDRPDSGENTSTRLAGIGGNVRLESASNFEAPPLTSTRLVLSVSNSPCEQILSLKKKRVQPPKSAIFENSSTTSEFSLPFAKKSSKRKPEAGNDLRRSKRKKNNTDDVFL